MPRIFFKKKLLGTTAIPQAETHSDEEKLEAVKISLVIYNQEHFEDISVTKFEDCIPYLILMGIPLIIF